MTVILIDNEILGNKDEAFWKELLKEADTNGDGVVN